MTTIKALEGRTVHQIQSGQVIVDLCSVVKELVENSLDAGSTSIDVRFKNNGLDAIEVQDNGIGISSENYETLALKHYTSKLTNYDDLTTLQTFGFRGEALSSLCALSNFHVITARAEDAPKGTRLDFETSGKLNGTSVVASQKGTTVAVENLFQNLPVRRRELEKNIKREYGKVLGILQAYACISTESKISVSNVMAKGRKAAVFATKSSQSTRENIANVFGAKVLPALTNMDLSFELQNSSTSSFQEWVKEGKPENHQVRVVGHVSRPVFGEGRQTPDRQMFFVNNRPCGLPQVAKIFNEVYKSYNVSQSPFIFANILLNTNAYDVNVSPDKRTILLHDQGQLLNSLRTSLTELFEKQDQTVPQTQPSLPKLPSFKQLTVQRDAMRAGSPKEATDKPRTLEVVDEAATATTRSFRDEACSSEQGTPANLIEKFARRNAQERTRTPTSNNGSRNGSESLSKDKQELVKKLGKEGVNFQLPDQYDDSRDLTASDDLIEARSIPVLDFNKRLAEQQAIIEDNTVESPNSPDGDMEQEIPSIAATPNKPSIGVVQNAFDRMRPQRSPTQTATITIGDKTTTSVLGPTVSKRQKVIPSPHTSKVTNSTASPAFSSSMRSFVAPGTQKGLKNSPSPRIGPLGEPKNEGRDDYSSSPESSAGSGESDSEEPKYKQSFDQRKSIIGEAETDDASDASDASDEDYMDEADKKAKEDAKVAALIQQAEETAALPSQDNISRASRLLKGGGLKFATTQLIQLVDQSVERIDQQLSTLQRNLQDSLRNQSSHEPQLEQEAASPEERLSLKVSKEDFARMHIVGQFNLGFILATRPSHSPSTSDELFIIDQHASDEKYNFERLQSTTVVQNQRLVHPQTLDLTAIEEEIILENNPALIRNGFLVDMDTSGDSPVGQRCKLVFLPMSREVTFDTTDLEELIALLAESGSSTSTIPRPSRVRKMFAMRACRSSVMIGKSLSEARMERLVRQMGEIDKPWNCPHGRPTMRHLLGLEAWEGWEEGYGVAGLDGEGNGDEKVDWRGWMSGRSGGGNYEIKQEGGGEDEEEFDIDEENTKGNKADEEDEVGGEKDAGEQFEHENDDEGSDGDEDEEIAEEDADEDGAEGTAAEPPRLNLLGRFGSRG